MIILLTESKSTLFFLTKLTTETFHSLINAFIETLILRHFNLNLHIQIKTNASDFIIEAVIS